MTATAGERAELIKELLLLKFHVGGSIGDISKRAADMLADDLPNKCGMSWGGFNLYGDEKSIKEAERMHHAAGIVPELKQLLCKAQKVAVTSKMTDEQIKEMALQEGLLLICDDFEALKEIVRAVESHHLTGAKP